MNVLDFALGYAAAGLSVFPIKTDGTKAPINKKWAPYQEEAADEEQVRAWWSVPLPPGIAIIAGAVSQNIEVMDFDDAATYNAFVAAVRDCGYEDTYVRLPLVETPDNGTHLYYRLSPTETVPGNTKLALHEVEGKSKASIETRGTGGYVLAPGCPVECHPSGKPYILRRGDLAAIPIISRDTWTTFRRIAESLSKLPVKATVPVGAIRTRGGKPPDTSLPGADYNSRGDLGTLLDKHGWTRLGTNGTETRWRRPGKTKGLSATTNWNGLGHFYTWSTSTEFEAEVPYSPFGVYAQLEHGGDFKKAAAALLAEGYGTPSVRLKLPARVVVSPDGDEELPDSVVEEECGAEDLDLAMAWADRHRREFIYIEGDQWWRCSDGRIWQYSSLEAAQASMQRFFIDIKAAGNELKITRSRISNVLFLAKSELGPKPLSIFDANPGWIPVANGVYDLATGTLLPHSPGNMITRCSSFNFDPTAQCPQWKKFLSEVLIETDGRKCMEWIDALQVWYGYCLVPDTSLQASMMWVGEGRNGKGVATRVLTELVGSRSVTNVPIEQLHDPYHMAALYGKLVGLVNEINPRAMEKNGNYFKALTGEDQVSGRRPCEKVFDFKPTLRMVISCNELPRTRDLSSGYFSKIILIEWRYNIPPEKRDRFLDRKLKAELSGIFNWALAGLQRLRNDPDLRIAPESSLRLLEDYQSGEDPVARFVGETYERTKNDEDKIPAKDIYSEYSKWCEANGEQKQSYRYVGLRLRKMGLNSVVARYGTDTFKCWSGIHTLSS